MAPCPFNSMQFTSLLARPYPPLEIRDRIMAFEASWLAEKAMEELEMLETQHPTRFEHLKLELKSLVSHPESCAQLFYGPVIGDDDALCPPASAAPTQVSSNRKRKSGWRSKDGEEKKAGKPSSAPGGRGGGHGRCKKSCSRVEAAVRRAEACLVRIQQVKQSLLC